MSKLSEYLKLLPNGLANISDVLKGFINDKTLDTLPEDKRDEIIRRRIICSECPFMSENAKTSQDFKDFSGSYYRSQRDDHHCTHCGCPISTRTASLDSNCGIEKYNKSHPDKQLPLKWSSYENREG